MTLENVHRLCLLPVVAPHVHAVAAHQDRGRPRVVAQRVRHRLLQVLLEQRVLDDRHHQLLVVHEIAVQLVVVDALDHLEMRAAELLARPEQRGHDGGRAVRVDYRPGAALLVREHKQWRALALR